MLTGKVIKWIDGRGYGFIEQDDGGPDLFTHIAYTGGKSLKEGDRVSYQWATDMKKQKPIAAEVRVIDNGR